MPQIEITIDPAGNPTVRTKGFAGKKCKDASKFIEQALGESVSETLTSEYYQTAKTTRNIEQKG